MLKGLHNRYIRPNFCLRHQICSPFPFADMYQYNIALTREHTISPIFRGDFLRDRNQNHPWH